MASTQEFKTAVVLPGDPTSAMQAATKQYVDNVSGSNVNVTVSATAPGNPSPGDLWVDTSPVAWTVANLQGGWSQYGAMQPQYFKDPYGLVHVRGAVNHTVTNPTGTGYPIFTLPAGYRPLMEHTWVVMSWNGYARIILTTGGMLWVFNYYNGAGIPGHLDLGNIQFGTT